MSSSPALPTGIMVFRTPLGAFCLNVTESMQRILKGRALEEHYPKYPEEIIERSEAAAHGWSEGSTPFGWDGRRAARWERARKRRHALGGPPAGAKDAPPQ